MTKFGFLILTFFFSTTAIGQIAEKDFDKAEILEKRYAEIVDSTKILTKNASLIYSHDSQFRCIHLKGTDDKIFLVDLVYVDDYAGYMEFKKDCNQKVLFVVRSDGSGNKPFYMTIDKKTGKKIFSEDTN